MSFLGGSGVSAGLWVPASTPSPHLAGVHAGIPAFSIRFRWGNPAAVAWLQARAAKGAAGVASLASCRTRRIWRWPRSGR